MSRPRAKTPEQSKVNEAARKKDWNLAARQRRMAAGERADGKPRTNERRGRKPGSTTGRLRTEEQKAAASAARVKALRERRKAAGEKQDGKPRKPRQPRTKKGA